MIRRFAQHILERSEKRIMSFVDVGNVRGQCFTVNIMHTGDAFVDISLQSDLLPSSAENWLVGVESLSCPLDSTRFLDEKHPTLLSLRRIQDGHPFNAPFTYLRTDGLATEFEDVGIEPALREWTDAKCTLRHTDFPCLEFGDLIDQIVGWCRNINFLINTVGLNRPDIPYVDNTMFNGVWDAHTMAALPADKKTFQHLKVRLSSSGSLSIIGSNMFWSNFYIEASSYMQALTGLPGIIAYNVEDEEPHTDWVGPMFVQEYVNDYEDPNDDEAYEESEITGVISLWGSADSRLSISVATDLPIQRSLTITDDNQCRDFSIGSFDLNNEISISTEVTNQLTSVFQFTSQSRAGHIALKPSGPPNYWVQMSPAVNLRHLRVRLMIRERVWDELSGLWGIKNKVLPIGAHQTWQCNLLFARKTH
jgi:hypothetical protein